MDVFETKFWCDIGHFNIDQAIKYRELCRKIRPKYAIEVGFCTGRSASCVLHYASTHLQRMISIDINLDWKEPGREMARILEHNFSNFRVIEASSQELLTRQFIDTEFPEGIDFVTIDGDHSFEGCYNDLNALAPYLNANGRIIVDDYLSGPPNGVEFVTVDQSVNRFLEENKGNFIGERWHSQGKGFCIIERI